MTKTIYRSVTSKRRTSRPKSKRTTTAFNTMSVRLTTASAALRQSRGRR